MNENHLVRTSNKVNISNLSVTPQNVAGAAHRELTAIEKINAQELYGQGLSLSRVRHLLGLSGQVTLGRIGSAVQAPRYHK